MDTFEFRSLVERAQRKTAYPTLGGKIQAGKAAGGTLDSTGFSIAPPRINIKLFPAQGLDGL